MPASPTQSKSSSNPPFESQRPLHLSSFLTAPPTLTVSLALTPSVLPPSSCDGFAIKASDVENILAWETTSQKSVEIPFKPARVLMQDFTGVPAVVDLAAMRNAMARLGGDPARINPLVPADLVVDHSVQVDFYRSPDALEGNLRKEMERNHERFAFLKWGSQVSAHSTPSIFSSPHTPPSNLPFPHVPCLQSLQNFLIVPPGSGIVHQVNLEYLARVVFNEQGVLYPDSVVGTDSHTTMINGLGVVGWGVGGIEAEAVMLGQPISMVLPEVVGYRLHGKMPSAVTATDLVLTITERLRQKGVVDKVFPLAFSSALLSPPPLPSLTAAVLCGGVCSSWSSMGRGWRSCRWPTAPPSATWAPSTAPPSASSPWTPTPSTTCARPTATTPRWP